MSNKYTRRTPPRLLLDRRDEGFQDGGGLHVAERMVREIELTVTLRQRAHEKRARAQQCRDSASAAATTSFVGIPPDEWVLHAERIPPEGAADREALLEAISNELDALELETIADEIRARVVETVAYALDHAAHAEQTKARQIAARRAVGDRNRRHLETAIENVRAHDMVISSSSVEVHWPAGVPAPQPRYLELLLAEWRLRTNQFGR